MTEPIGPRRSDRLRSGSTASSHAQPDAPADLEEDDVPAALAPTGSKKRSAGKVAVPGSKRPPKRTKRPGNIEGVLPIQDGSDVAAPTTTDIAVELDPINLARSAYTGNLNRWYEATKDGKMKLTKATPPFDLTAVGKAEEEMHAAEEKSRRRKALLASNMPVTELHEANIYDNRSFEVVDVQRSTVQRRANKKAETTTVEIWTIFVRNSSRVDSPTLPLYGETPVGTTSIIRSGGPLETTMYSEDDIQELAKSVCVLLDRFPSSLQEEKWNTPKKNVLYRTQAAYVYPRRLVEVLALNHWKPGFDYSSLYEDYTIAGRSQFRSVTPTASIVKNGTVPKRFLHICEGINDESEDDVWSEPFLQPKHLKFAEIELIEPPPSSFINRTTTLVDLAAVKNDIPEPLSTHQQDLILRLINYIVYNAMTKVGGLKQLREHLQTLLLPYTSQNFQHLTSQEKWAEVRFTPGAMMKGPFGGKRLWRLDQTPKHVVIQPTEAAKAAVSGRLPDIRIPRRGRLEVSYCLNQILLVLSAGRDVPNSWQAGSVAADEVALNRISPPEILALQCLCENIVHRANSVHICALCFAIRLCSDMVELADGRLVCSLHRHAYEEAFPEIEPSVGGGGEPAQLRYALNRAVTQTVNREGTFTAELRQTLRAKLSTFIDGSDPSKYVDAYDGVRQRQKSTFRNIVGKSGESRSTRVLHPLNMSLEAVLPLVMVEEQLFIHHPDNVVLTADCFNFVKARWSPAFMPLLPQGGTQTAREEGGAPRDLAFWTYFNIGLDHLHRLLLLTPYARAKRLQVSVTSEQLRQLSNAWRSGEWNQDLPNLSSPTAGRLLTAGDLVSGAKLQKFIEGEIDTFESFSSASKTTPRNGLDEQEKPARLEARKRCVPWTQGQKHVLATIVTEIEKDILCNPHGLIIPRGSRGAPWPFRKDHMFSDDDDLWNWWHRELSARYMRMFDKCDMDHDTQESPATLLIEIVVQWFEKGGGIDDYIHCEMTVWMSHPSRFSIGRAANVQPGSPMRTGCTVPFPTSFRLHYDASRRTVTVQPYFVNLLWKNYDTGLHAQIRNALQEITMPETPHYISPRRDLPSISYPKESRVSLRQRKQQNEAAPEEEPPDDDIEAEEPEEDDLELAGDSLDQNPLNDPPGGKHSKQSSGQRRGVGILLTLRLRALKDEIRVVSFTEDQERSMRELVSQIEEATKQEDVPSFDKAEKEIRELTMSLPKDTSKLPQDQRFNCAACSEHDLEGNMVICSGEHAAILHFWCADLSAMPSTDEAVYCRQCREQHARTGTEGIPNNVPNLGATCYASSSMQILRSLPGLREALRDSEFLCKPLDESGRLAEEWLTSAYNVVASTPAAEKQKAFSQHMLMARRLADEIVKMADRIGDHKAGHVSRREWETFFNAIHNYDSKEWQSTEMNDAATLFSNLLDCLILVTDSSVPTGRGRIKQMNEEIWMAEIAGDKRPALVQELAAMLHAYSEEGRASKLFGLIASQIVLEWECPTCHRVGRSVEHGMVVMLDLLERIEGTTAIAYALKKVLDKFFYDQVPDGVACPYEPETHGKAPVIFKRLTRLPPILTFHFKRHAAQRLEHVDLPEFIDLTPYAEDMVLPSERRKNSTHNKFGNDCIYRLFAVDMFIPAKSHYVPYIAQGQQWVSLDDLYGNPGIKTRHPQAAVNEGQVPYYAVYVCQKGWKSLPTDDNKQPTQGFVLARGAPDPGPVIKKYQAPEPELFACPRAEKFGCTYMFSTLAEAQDHAAMHPDHDEGVDPMITDDDFSCNQCGEKFASEAELDSHRHALHPRVHCNECGAGFDSEAELRAHREVVHPQFTCNQCHAHLSSEEELKAHQETQHPQFHCQQCSDSFNSQNALNDHQHNVHMQQTTQPGQTITLPAATVQQMLQAITQATTAANEATAAATEAREALANQQRDMQEILGNQRRALESRERMLSSTLRIMRTFCQEELDLIAGKE